MNKNVNMLSGSIVKTVFALALPIMVMNVLQSVFNLIDSTILKMYDTSGGYAVGAVGVCATLIALITNLITGIATGSNVVVAKALGKNNQEQVERAIGVSLLFAFFGGVFLLIIGLSCATVFLRWTNCSEVLLPQASLYFRLYFLAGPLMTMYNFCAVILRASGDSRRPMIYLTIGGIVKVLFTLIFVAVFNMQIVGVAIATILSWVVSFGLVFIALLRNNGV
ncbi:MAG: polysaccharide biosynthesis C-terminal domain-containing protein, partial [Clostridia bacterium]|nr:polysaccharide biosynthesis C-terminal domain-containing protein [Clostridia bacterium]